MTEARLGDTVTYTAINNIVSFAYRLISRDGGHVLPLNIINTVNPDGVHHSHKHYELELVLDSDCNYAFYTQKVQAGAPGVGTRAIKQAAANDWIQYFVVYIRESDGTTTTLTWANGDAEVLWCVGETHDYSNERGMRHLTTTYRFVCFIDPIVAGW